MGSPLGVLFANMYMATVEERTFQRHQKPKIYGRYIDDIFITTRKGEDPRKLADALQENSVLNFTIEHSHQKTLPFLDVLVQQNDGQFTTSVYVKATNTGRCLNARGECPEAFKKSVVSAYINRAFSHCTSWRAVNQELDRVRQLLTNNGYEDQIIENAIKKKMDDFHRLAPKIKEEDLTLYYQLNYGTAFKDECRTLRGIIQRGVTPKAPYQNVNLRIYSKPNLVASLVMKNSTAPDVSKEMWTNVVYKFTCAEEMCKSPSKTYIGHTTTTIRRRMLAHRNQGAIHQHFVDYHDKKPSLQELINNTQIVHRESRINRLMIAEAVSIAKQNPTLNVQQESDQVLPSSRRRNLRTREDRPTTPRGPSGENLPQSRRVSLRPRPLRIEET